MVGRVDLVARLCFDQNHRDRAVALGALSRISEADADLPVPVLNIPLRLSVVDERPVMFFH